MGVIDLDKRVKKLEQADVAGGAELDQLEAAVTAIENDLTVTTTDLSDDAGITSENVTITKVLKQVYGKIVVFFLNAYTGESEGGFVSYKSPANELPSDTGLVLTGEYPLAMEADDGDLYVYAELEANSNVVGTIAWIIDPPAPTPGE